MFLSRWNRSSNSYCKTCPVRDSMLVKRMSAPKATSHRDVMLSWNLAGRFNQGTYRTYGAGMLWSSQGYKHAAPMEQGFALITVPGSLPENDEYPKLLLIIIN